MALSKYRLDPGGPCLLYMEITDEALASRKHGSQCINLCHVAVCHAILRRHVRIPLLEDAQRLCDCLLITRARQEKSYNLK